MANRKLKLDLDGLDVETFSAGGQRRVRGTAFGHSLEVIITNGYFSCGDSYNDPCAPSHVPTNCEGETSYEATCRDSVTAC